MPDGSAYYVILIKTYIEQLPQSLEESALIDGASTLTIFFKIIMPLSLPIAATIAVYSAVGHWNAWFDNHIFAFNNKNLTTLQYMLYNYLSEAQRLIEQLKQSRQQIDLSQLLTSRGVHIYNLCVVYNYCRSIKLRGISMSSISLKDVEWIKIKQKFNNEYIIDLEDAVSKEIDILKLSLKKVRE